MSDSTAPVETVVKQTGKILFPALLCGVGATALALVLDLLHVFSYLEAVTLQFFDERNLASSALIVGQKTEWLICFLVAVAVSFVLLDSAYIWRRLFLGLIASVLVVGAMFSLSLWGLVFMPYVLLVGVLGATSFCILYASQHQMECEGAVVIPSEEIKVGVTTKVVQKVTKLDKNQVPADIKEKKEQPVKKQKPRLARKETERIPLPRVIKSDKPTPIVKPNKN